MSKRRRRRNVPPRGAPCESWGPDDGLDPHELFAYQDEDDNEDSQQLVEASRLRKDRQLCKEAFRTLSLAFAELAVRDRLLAEVELCAVDPAPDASRLRLTLRGAGDLAAIEGQLERLRGYRGVLRSALAAALHRKRVPQLELALASNSEEVTHG